jgi:hypothetical protein
VNDRHAPFLTIPEALEALGCGRTTLYTKYFAHGDLHRTHDGRSIVVPADEIRRLKARLNFPPADDPLLREIVARAAVLAVLSPIPTRKALHTVFAALESAARDVLRSADPTDSTPTNKEIHHID